MYNILIGFLILIFIFISKNYYRWNNYLLNVFFRFIALRLYISSSSGSNNDIIDIKSFL